MRSTAIAALDLGIPPTLSPGNQREPDGRGGEDGVEDDDTDVAHGLVAPERGPRGLTEWGLSFKLSLE